MPKLKGQSLKQAILSTLLFYDILDYPLTDVEIWKYLNKLSPELNNNLLGQIRENLNSNHLFSQKNGFYFLKGRQNLVKQRIKKQKIADQKWKKIIKISRSLQMIPYIKAIAVTGSLTLNNTKNSSDLDLLIIVKSGRIWLTRTLITLWLSLIRQKRHQNNIQNKVCLNCYLTDESLEIRPEIKPHNLYSAQEYARLMPLFAVSKNFWQKFQTTNKWIKEFLHYWPRTYDENLKKTSAGALSRIIRLSGEKLLNNTLGDLIENTLKKHQIKRIEKKLTKNADDQIFFDDHYLMFHPHSKAINFLKTFNHRWRNLQVVDNVA